MFIPVKSGEKEGGWLPRPWGVDSDSTNSRASMKDGSTGPLGSGNITAKGPTFRRAAF